MSRLQSTEYGLRILKACEVGAGLCRALLGWEVKAEPCPYPRAELARKTRGAARLARSANPTKDKTRQLGRDPKYAGETPHSGVHKRPEAAAQSEGGEAPVRTGSGTIA